MRDDDQRGLGVVRPKFTGLLKNQAPVRIDPQSNTNSCPRAKINDVYEICGLERCVLKREYAELANAR